MEIPVRLILTLAAFFALLLSFLGALVWRTRRTYAGSGRQTIANLLFSLCLLLFALRPALPDWIGVVAANAVLAAAAILSLEATRKYRGLHPRVSFAYAGGILAVLAVVYFDYVVKNINARVFAVSAFMGVMANLCSVTLLRERYTGRRLGVPVSAGMFAMSGMLLMARAIYFLFAPPLTDLFAPSWANTAFFVGCALSIACCSIGWRELTDERVLMDLKEAESRTARANREVTEATERANSMAQRAAIADSLRSEFLETMNHEIRNPLGGVMAATDLLLVTDLTPEQQECTLAVRTEAETLLKVNDDLLNLSEIEVGSVVIKSSAFELRGVIEEAARTYAQVAKGKQIDLVVAYLTGIPRRFCGDASKIRQVLVNLVGHAVTFTSSGQVLVAVACEAQDAHRAQIWVSVTSSGIDIPPEAMQALFEKSSHGPSWASRIQGGAGIRLVVSKKLIELMGGRLNVESQVGEGSKFWFTLPLPVEDGSP